MGDLKVQSSQDVPKYQYTVPTRFIPHKFGGSIYFACFADEMDPTFRVCAEILKHFEKKIFQKC